MITLVGEKYFDIIACFLCIQERVQQYEGFVADHQNYNDAYNSCVDWLNSIREKLSACSDVSGDRHAIQSRLDKIQVSVFTHCECLDAACCSIWADESEKVGYFVTSLLFVSP